MTTTRISHWMVIPVCAAVLGLTDASLRAAQATLHPTDPDICALFPAADVAAALRAAGLDVQVAEARAGAGSCRYALTGRDARTVMIDVAELASAAEAERQFRALVADLPGAKPMPGVGDEAVLIDNGPYGTYSVKYRSGRVVGQVNLRANGAALDAAVVALAKDWTRRLGASLAVAPSPAASPTEPAPAEPAAAKEVAPAAPARGRWERVPDEPRRSLPPLPPLRWADADSAARARGLLVTTKAPSLPADIPPALHVSRVLRNALGSDTLFSAETLDLLDEQARGMLRQADEAARARRGALRLDGSTGLSETPVLDPRDDLGFVLAGGPSAAEQWWFPTPGQAGRPAALASAPRPEWFRESFDVSPPSQTAADGTTVGGRGTAHRYMEPWRRGMGMTLEQVIGKTVGDVSAHRTFRHAWEASTDICPSADGIVRGRGTYEARVGLRFQQGAKVQTVQLVVSNSFVVTARVNDDAVPVSFDVDHSVEVRETVQGTDREDRDVHWITEAAQTGAASGISPGADGSPSRDPAADDGTINWETILTTEGSSEMIALVIVFAGSQARESLEEAFDEWWSGSCLEVRSRRQPEQPRLRAGESSGFELEVYHYQDEDVVALPVEIRHPADAAAGTVSPTEASEGPARFTFTAPSAPAWREWTGTEIRSHSTSRRGRAHVPAEGPSFSRRDEREYISITARRRTSTELAGDVYDFHWDVILERDDEDPGRFGALGTFEGVLVGLDANCLDGYDIPPTVSRHRGRVHYEWGGFLYEGDGERTLFLSLAGDLPPLDGLERAVGFSVTEGLPIPPPGSGAATYRMVLPHGFTGTMTECSGAVQSIWEVTLSSWRADS